MLVWFYNKKWVIRQMGGFCMKKIIMAAGENSQTILLDILVIICIIIVLNMISFFYLINHLTHVHSMVRIN